MLSTFGKIAGMAKLVDALALGASGAIRGGSSPLPGTRIELVRPWRAFVFEERT